MNYDAMGSYYGQVNDVLEQPSTEANVKPVTQTITTDPTTGEQMMTVKGRPEDLSAANPNTPTVSQPKFNFGAPPVQAPVQQAPQPVAPVAPPQDQTFQRMVQAESGGQNFTPTGQPLTSPKGAMFANQVMPATAMNPGYGVRPAAAQTPEEYNRVGQDYYNAMLNKFGNPQAAAAAYNAGPGRVQQNIQQNQGQLNVGQLPQETQAYLQKVQPGQAPAPVAPTAPTAPAQPMIAGAPSTDVGMTPTEQAIKQTPEQYWSEYFIKNQNDPAAMAKLRYNDSVPNVFRTLASQKELQDLQYKDKTQKVQQNVQAAIESGDGRALANMINPRGKDKDEGSIAKAFLFSLIGFQSGAQAEVEKMGLKDKWDVTQVGSDQVAVKYNPRGEAKEAIYTTGERAGQRVPDEQLATLYGAGAGGKVTTSGTFFQDKDGNIVRAQSDEKGRTKLVDAASGERYTGSSKGLIKLEEAGALRKMDYGLITDLKKQFGTDAIKAATKFQELSGPFKSDAERSQFLQLYGFGQAQPTTMPSAPPPTGVVTQQPPPVPNTVLPGAQNDQGLVRQPPGAAAPVAPTQVQAPSAPAPTTAPVPARTDLTKPIATLQQETAAEKPNIEQAAKNRNQAEKIFPFVTQIRDLVDKSTGSGVGSLVDSAGGWVGYTTSGAEAIAAIKPLASKILMGVERFEGPQSNIDVQSYKEAAGQLADPKVPAKQKQAAFNTIIDIMERNAPGMDWSQFKTGGATKTGAPAAGTTKTINGVTYEYDGRGWKKSTGI